MVLTLVQKNFWKSLGSHVIYLMLVHQVPSHSHVLDEGKTHFYEENMIRHIAINFEVISYKPLLDLLNLPPIFSRNVAPAYFTTIQDNRYHKSFNGNFFLSHMTRLVDLHLFSRPK